MKLQYPTLEQIRETIREEGKIIIAAFDKDIKLIEGRLGNVEDRLGNVESRLGNVESKLDAHIKQNETEYRQIMKRFDDNDDAHQELLGASDEICDRKIEKHCQEKHSFATS